MVSQATSPRLDELSLIQQRLKHAVKADDFTHVQGQLNGFESQVRYSLPLVQAHFFLLRGVLLVKSVSLRQHGWLRPPANELLQEALAHFAVADRECRTAVEDARGWSTTLSRFHQSCAYETCVATTHLRALGYPPDLVFDTSRLDARQQRNYLNALRYRHTLRSAF